MKAMARKTPPAKELAIPRILGFSRHDGDQVGIIPATPASIVTRIMKMILVQRIRVSFSSVGSSSSAKTIGSSFYIFFSLIIIIFTFDKPA